MNQKMWQHQPCKYQEWTKVESDSPWTHCGISLPKSTTKPWRYQPCSFFPLIKNKFRDSTRVKHSPTPHWHMSTRTRLNQLLISPTSQTSSYGFHPEFVSRPIRGYTRAQFTSILSGASYSSWNSLGACFLVHHPSAAPSTHKTLYRFRLFHETTERIGLLRAGHCNDSWRCSPAFLSNQKVKYYWILPFWSHTLH